MKKAAMGLAGIVLSFAGCKSTMSIDEEAKMIKYHSNEIRRILEVKPEETCQIVDLEAKKGEPFSVIIKGENEDKITAYYDDNKDSKYDKKTLLKVPHQIDIFKIPAEPNQPENKLKKYQPKKQENLQKKEKSKQWAYASQ